MALIATSKIFITHNSFLNILSFDNSILSKAGKSARGRIENFLASHQKVSVEMAGLAKAKEGYTNLNGIMCVPVVE